jgi:ABC-type multidrug transport system fused ATPase/permease subunit|tara:strand:+ start:2928 stop:3350 length:423 start_codon:yes stop_codon:yes gene_type:complete
MLEYLLTSLNASKLFSVFIIFIMNIGSKYMAKDVPVAVDLIFENFWARMFVVFCVAFVSTRDIFMSLIITLLFILLFKYILNEKSSTCVIKKRIDDYKMNNISEQDVARAYQVINEYNLIKNTNQNKQIDTNDEDNNIFI